jgi:DNA-binding NarL/FixJ family response regulator
MREERGFDRITVLIASDRPSMLLALSSLLRHPAIDLLSEEPIEPQGLAAEVARHAPAVLLLDAAMLDRLDERAVQGTLGRNVDTNVLLVGDEFGHGRVVDVLRHRFQGYLATTCTSEVCLKAVRAVDRGELWLSRTALANAIAQLLPNVEPIASSAPALNGVELRQGLTPREMQIVELVRRGCSNKEIAHALGVVEDTVKKHLQSVFGKLGVHRRALVALRPPHRASGFAEGLGIDDRHSVSGSTGVGNSTKEELAASSRGGRLGR